MEENKKFKFPVQIINQISECSNGFFLATLNQDNEFEVFQNMPNPATHLALANFLDIFSNYMQESLRNRPFNTSD